MTENTYNVINPEDGVSIKVGTQGCPARGCTQELGLFGVETLPQPSNRN